MSFFQTIIKDTSRTSVGTGVTKKQLVVSFSLVTLCDALRLKKSETTNIPLRKPQNICGYLDKSKQETAPKTAFQMQYLMFSSSFFFFFFYKILIIFTQISSQRSVNKMKIYSDRFVDTIHGRWKRTMRQ